MNTPWSPNNLVLIRNFTHKPWRSEEDILRYLAKSRSGRLYLFRRARELDDFPACPAILHHPYFALPFVILGYDTDRDLRRLIERRLRIMAGNYIPRPVYINTRRSCH